MQKTYIYKGMQVIRITISSVAVFIFNLESYDWSTVCKLQRFQNG